MAILTLTTSQKSVCAIPHPGVSGKPDWKVRSKPELIAIEDISEDGLSATIVAGDIGGDVVLVTVEASGDDDRWSIATLIVQVSDPLVTFAEVSPGAPDEKQEEKAERKKAPAKE